MISIEKNRKAMERQEIVFQEHVNSWMHACFGAEVAADTLERADRFLEEALELLQSADYPQDRILSLLDYVYGREKGELKQEVGGTMMTLAAFCSAYGVSMLDCGQAELSRVWDKIDAIRAKQAAKPKGSALPVASAAASTEVFTIGPNTEHHVFKTAGLTNLHDLQAVLDAVEIALGKLAAEPEGYAQVVTYTNYRGETSQRTIKPKCVWFGSTEWHPEPQWLLNAFDVEKGADRDFALKDFGAPSAPAVAVKLEKQPADFAWGGTWANVKIVPWEGQHNISDEIVEIAAAAYWNKVCGNPDRVWPNDVAPEVRSVFRVGCRAALKATFAATYGDEEKPRYTTKRLRYELQQERMATLEDAAQVSISFAEQRPLSDRDPSQRVIGRWEGEQAAASNIANAIRALKNGKYPIEQSFDDESVTQFATAMKAKMKIKAQQGRGGWHDKSRCSNAHLSALLREHVEKGDPVDVANIAMMIGQRCERIAKDPTARLETKAFHIDQPVEKFTGDYTAKGEVRGIFAMKSGAVRYVVEHQAEGGGSFCHIYSEKNLRPDEPEAVSNEGHSHE